MRKWKLLGALAVGLIALIAVGATTYRPRPERISRENYDRIGKGMGREEVEAILGPPGDYSTGPIDIDTSAERWVDEVPSSPPDAMWHTDTCGLWIKFNDSNKVEFQGFLSVQRVEQSFLDNLRWRVERQWREWFP
jgi:hypothetical protein